MTLAVLSWKSLGTLFQTLDSFERFGLDDAQKIIFFQESGRNERLIAAQYGFESIGSFDNIGIGPAIQRLVAEATGEFFLFVENDFKLIEDPDNDLFAGKYYLGTKKADVIRYRHRANPGNPLWSRQFAGNELSRPEHLLDCVHWEDNPEKKFPEQIQRYEFHTGRDKSDFYLTTAKYANWTNNPFMARTEWLKEHIVPRMSGDIEKNIQPWWQQQDFKVLQGRGLFTHERID